MIKFSLLTATFSVAVAFTQLAPMALAERLDLQTNEEQNPISLMELQALTPDTLQRYNQTQLDYLYGQLQSGAIPDGPYEVGAIFTGDPDNDVGHVAGALLGDNVEGFVKYLGVNLWQHNVFSRNRGKLINRVGFLQRFPAKIYCGQSLVDSRRESVILDYVSGAKLDTYDPVVDALASGSGLAVRAEIRMIRPGFYLGRTYFHDIFALNFTLFKDPTTLNRYDAVQTCLNAVPVHF